MLDEVLLRMEESGMGVTPSTCDALRKVVTDSAVLSRLDRLQAMWPPNPKENQGIMIHESVIYFCVIAVCRPL